MIVVFCYYSVTLFTTRGSIRPGLVAFFEGIFTLVDV